MHKLSAPFLFLYLSLGLLVSCNSRIKNVFRGERTPHEAYSDRLDDKDLDKTPAGRQWLAAAEVALQHPHTIQLPYRHHGYFHIDKPRALGLQFEARAGERILIQLKKSGSENFTVFADLFKQNASSTSRILSADTLQQEFSFDADEAGTYVLRLQPELFRTGHYSLAISTGPSLSFPVTGSKAKAGSFWGAERDGGKRSHEGVDIFAPKGTPAVAAADGYVAGVREGGIGGKTVWLRPSGKNYTLYYAHLDEQLVREGQFVKRGETIGTVGNTGNARSTPPHLHFGIYTFGGAIDPWPYVNPAERTAPPVAEKKLVNHLKLTKDLKTGDGMLLRANLVLVPLAVTQKDYLVDIGEGRVAQTPFNVVKTIEPVKTQNGLAAAAPGKQVTP